MGILPQAPRVPEGLTVYELVAQGRYPPAAERKLIESDPLLKQLSVFQDGHVIFFEGNDPIYGALSFLNRREFRLCGN